MKLGACSLKLIYNRIIGTDHLLNEDKPSSSDGFGERPMKEFIDILKKE